MPKEVVDFFQIKELFYINTTMVTVFELYLCVCWISDSWSQHPALSLYPGVGGEGRDGDSHPQQPGGRDPC